MARGLHGLVIAVLGGDYREIELIREFLSQGAKVKAIGYPPMPELAGVEMVSTIWDAIRGSDVIVVGMGGLDVGGKVRTLDSSVNLQITEEVLSVIPPNVPFFIGIARPRLKEFARKHNVRLIEVTEQDDVAILNSIPTAEGAIQIAMEELPITIHGCNAIVIGLGRVGMTMARTLIALGARTTVVARNPAQLARAEEMGARPVPLSDLKDIVGQADVIFNTVPAVVLTESVLRMMRPNVLIIDLASHPGGTDFEAAAKLQIKAILALGLPGKVAPKTSGQILVKCVPEMIHKALGHWG
ncbi:MAG TPA: dipicolinate synthase subunit DpsA [Firmicutes bacterium]|nr:dipicolinate synthase subunit DpsA [Bacillota bacterium]